MHPQMSPKLVQQTATTNKRARSGAEVLNLVRRGRWRYLVLIIWSTARLEGVDTARKSDFLILSDLLLHLLNLIHYSFYNVFDRYNKYFFAN